MTRIGLAFAGLLFLAAPAVSEEPDLDSLKWVARPLVIFADTAADPKFIQQTAWLEADPDPLADRRVVVLSDTDPEANGPLRQRLRPRGFGVVLIDTDGRISRRWPLPVTVRELSNLIDRMPSRREETGSQRP